MNIKLKIAIIKAGLSQRELARETGIHESLISMAVRGRYILDEEQKRRISTVLRRPELEIFGQ